MKIGLRLACSADLKRRLSVRAWQGWAAHPIGERFALFAKRPPACLVSRACRRAHMIHNLDGLVLGLAVLLVFTAVVLPLLR